MVPSDVRITTVDTNGPVYLSDPVTLSVSATQAYFSARSLFAGTVSNSPSRVICYVYAITPVASASLLQAVQDTIDQTVAFPLTGDAVSPDLVGITMATTISMIAGSSSADGDTAVGQATAAAQVYIKHRIV